MVLFISRVVTPLFVVCLLATMFLKDQASGDPASAKSAAQSDLHHQQLLSLLDEEWQYELRSSPELATSIGDNRYNDRLGDVSPEFYQADLEQRPKVMATFETL